MGRTIHKLTLKRDQGQKWGFGVSGGKDCALTFRIEKVSLASPAGYAGLKNMDYLIKVNGKEVFDMGHNQLVQMIKNLGKELELEIERAEEEDFVVPSFDMFCPKEKEAKPDASDYYKEAMKYGLGPDSEIPSMFTACGKPRLKTGKYNTSVTLYSEETLMELSSSGGHGFVDPEKLHPDACPAAKNRKRFDPSKSSALEVLLSQEKGECWPENGSRAE